MEKLSKRLLLIVAISLIGFNSCTSTKNNASYYSYEVKCIGSSLNGIQTVKAWGKGIDKKKALEQAKKNALDEILFQGIRQGSADCNTRPIISEINAKSKYRNYFNSFYSKGYSDFVSINKKNNELQKFNTDQGYLIGTILSIRIDDLKQRLFDDNILSKP